jgi:hypothetical protein
MEGSMTALDTEIREGVERETVEAVQALGGKYKYGWETEIEMEYAPKGVNEDIVRLISDKNGEPEWMTDWRLQAFKRWKQMEEPNGRWSTTRPSTTRTSITTRAPRACRKAEVARTRSIRSFCAPMKSWASR